MFGLDDRITALSDGASLWLVVVVAILLGLRHASDPDHVAAVTALVASGRERASRGAGRLGLAWGVGHGTALVAIGLPVVLFRRHLPEDAYRAAEVAVALVIVVLAVRLLRRWRKGHFHVHVHEHDGVRHSHLHAHAHDDEVAHAHSHVTRTPAAAFGIGLLHGIGGSAGVTVLLLASIDSTALAVIALALFAVFTAASMVALSSGFGVALAARPLRAAIPALGIAALGFGVWYALGALELAPYVF